MMKFGICIAFPGTPMFSEYRQKGLIRTYIWDEYFIYTEKPLFNHPNLTYEKVQEYVRLAYSRAVTTNPAFIARRFIRGVKTGEFFWDIYYFLKFMTSPAVNRAASSAIYFAKDRWPKYDFEHKAITYYPPRPASNVLTPELVRGLTV